MKICLNCGKQFEPTPRCVHIYCSQNCGKKMWGKRNPEKNRQCKANATKSWRERRMREMGHCKDSNYKERHREYMRRYSQTVDIRKKRARHALNGELRAGRMTKQSCAVCGAVRVQAHHGNYDKPLDVIWLCSKHHHALHRGELSYQALPAVAQLERTVPAHE